MNKQINNNEIYSFLKSLSTNVNPNENRWSRGMVGEDLNFFSSCIEVFKTNNICSVLDIGTGPGTLIKMCLESDIEAYGVDPIIDESNNNCYVGTMSSVIKNENLLKNYQFSCISCINFLHGKNHIDTEIVLLFEMIKRRANFTLISEPNIKLEEKEKCMKNLLKIHSFDVSHGGAHHTLYKILK
jgi:hypothetical protein